MTSDLREARATPPLELTFSEVGDLERQFEPQVPLGKRVYKLADEWRVLKAALEAAQREIARLKEGQGDLMWALGEQRQKVEAAEQRIRDLEAALKGYYVIPRSTRRGEGDPT